MGEKSDTKQMEVPKEVLARNFDKNLEDIMTIDEDSKETKNAMWWNGSSLEFGKLAPVNSYQNQRGEEAISKPKK